MQQLISSLTETCAILNTIYTASVCKNTYINTKTKLKKNIKGNKHLLKYTTFFVHNVMQLNSWKSCTLTTKKRVQ